MKSKNQTLFASDWYLEIVCGKGNWELIKAEDKNNIEIANLPIFKKKKIGIRYLSMPLFTPYLGFEILHDQELKESKSLSFQEKALDQIIDKLEGFQIISFNCHPENKNIYPFLKRGFRARVRYTYIINKEVKLEGYLGNMSQKLRKELERSKIDIKQEKKVDEFLELLILNFQEKKISKYVDIEMFRKLDVALKERKQRQIFCAHKGGVLLGGIYLVSDEEYTYLLFTALDKKTTENGVVAKLIDYAIKESLMSNKSFDFEGSSIPSVEKFFRKFGGELVPYFELTNEKNKFWRFAKMIRGKI